MTQSFRSKIAIDKNICHGKPYIIGTRIVVQQVLDLLATEATIEEIIEEDFPDLTRDDILVCVAYTNKKEDVISEKSFLFQH